VSAALFANERGWHLRLDDGNIVSVEYAGDEVAVALLHLSRKLRAASPGTADGKLLRAADAVDRLGGDLRQLSVEWLRFADMLRKEQTVCARLSAEKLERCAEQLEAVVEGAGL
jgi:hypothetical protein